MGHGGKRANTGGARHGAGRKPRSINRSTALTKAAELNLIPGSAAAEAVSAASILATVDEKAKWLELIEASNDRDGEAVPDWNTRRQALEYLTDQRDGKASDSRRFGPRFLLKPKFQGRLFRRSGRSRRPLNGRATGLVPLA